jgi:hypothetical protein
MLNSSANQPERASCALNEQSSSVENSNLRARSILNVMIRGP